MADWNEICFVLSKSLPTNISEQLFEQKVIQALEKMGWSQYKGELAVRESIQIGSVNRINPDITIRSENGENEIVVEIKKPSEDLGAERFRNQLFSYMRMTRVNLGILIGSKIQIYVDGSLLKSDDPILIEEITFTEDNAKGDRFFELFSKTNYSREKLKTFIDDKLSKKRQAQIKNEIRNSIESFDTNRIIEFLKEELSKDFDSDLIQEVINDYDVSVERKNGGKDESASNEIRNIKKSDTFRFIPAKEKGSVIYNSNYGALPIELNPPNEYDFKRRLLSSKTAWITTIYNDGRKFKKRWDANKMTENSNLLGNLRSRPDFRNGTWQKLGIAKVYVSISSEDI